MYFKLFFIIILLFFCKEKEVVKKESKTIDLIKKLNNSKVQNFSFNEKKELINHTKKNTARYTIVPETRWLNSQITFNTDRELFVNESNDSIMLTPNSSIEFEVDKDVYKLELAIGILSDNSEKAGRFVIEIDDKLDEENSVLIEQTEKWLNVEKIVRIDKKIKFIWNSNDSFAFIGHPILTPVNQKKDFPNIILIVVDAMRFDSLSQNGNPFQTSPNLDLLQKDSIYFTQSFCNANWTKPSMISMFYSEYSSNLGLGNTGFEVSPNQKKIFYSNNSKGIVNFLRDKKYYTASIMNNVFLLDYTGIGVDIGFHELIQVGKDVQDSFKITNSTLEFLERDFQNPFFLHINYNTPHGPYTPPQKYLDNIKNNTSTEIWNKELPSIKRYLAEINFVDEQIGIILNKLKEKNLYDNTIIAITSDHGELFSDHHTISVNGINGVKFGHGVTHYEEEIQVPLLIKPHSKIKEKILNKKIDQQFSLISLFPTILGLSNINKEGFKHKGKDFSQFIFGFDSSKEDVIYTEGRLSESIRKNGIKYIRRYPFFSSSELSGRVLIDKELEEIYDLTNDPDEKINLISDKKTLKELRTELSKNSLELNSFHLYLPKLKSGENFSGSMSLSGGIYNVFTSPDVQIDITSRKSFNFKNYSTEKNSKIIIMSIQPNLEFDLSIYKNNKPINFRVGKWGLLHKSNSYDEYKLLVSHSEPEGFTNSELPWIYNDEKISVSKEEKMNQILGAEVRQILKSWGYIHE